MKNNKAKRLPVNYIEQGSGTPTFLIHGLGSSLHNWRYLMPSLALNGFHPFAIDLPGHGGSPKTGNAEGYHIEKMIHHLVSWIRALNQKPPFILIGHSLGGYLALRYALLNPLGVRALVLVNPLYRPSQLAPQVRPVLEKPGIGTTLLRLVPYWILRSAASWALSTSRRMSPAMRFQIALDFKRADPYITHIGPTLEDLTDSLAEVRMPVLVAYGDRDLTLDPESFPDFARALPQAEERPFHGAGHTPHLTQTILFNQEVLRFLRAADPDPQAP
jgi:pimeloyl-ACP methyl ester carboxylesterase